MKELDIAFSEVNRMERDLEFLKTRLMDEMCLGLFLVDTREYKETLFNEIRGKIAFAKKLM